MPKKTTINNINLYYEDDEQVEVTNKDKVKIKKAREREKKMQENKLQNKEKKFDLENETVIQMTNKNKKKKDEQIKKELSKKERKRKKKIKKLKLILKCILFLGLISSAIIFALTSPIFNIKEIVVSNNINVPSDTIISLSELKTEENIFKFYKGSVKNKIKENPYIEDVKITRKLPNTIEIDVAERNIKYSADFMGKYAYIDTKGYILEISEDSKGLPVIQGITTKEEDIIPGNKLNEEDCNKLQDVVKILNATHEIGLEEKVTSIDISNKNEYSIYLEEEKKTIYIGDNTNLTNKMLYVISILEQEKGKEGYIYVNGELNNKFKPYFKEKV